MISKIIRSTFVPVMVKDVKFKEIEKLFRTPILQQTAYWSKVKSHFGAEPMAFNFFINEGDSYNVRDLVVFVKMVDKEHSIAYVPYGPEAEPSKDEQGALLEQLSEMLMQYLPKGCIMIRYDLVWESMWSDESQFVNDDGIWMGPPSPGNQEIRFNYSTIKGNFRKAPSNILPSNTVLVNLKSCESDMLGRMKPKTRYNISLSARKGVIVRVAGLESISVWYKLYKETAKRNNFFLHSEDYFRIALTERATDSLSPADVSLLIAEYDSVPLAAMFLVVSDRRATYLYGASSSEHRGLMAPYSLQWRAMMIAKEKGCTQYDMFGVSPGNDISHPLYGLYRFKTGFGGSLYHAMGCWDYPLNHKVYPQYIASEVRNQGYHLA